MSNPTPGPWRWGEPNRSEPGAVGDLMSETNGKVTADVLYMDAYEGWVPNEADARLIASAPSLLQDLGALVGYLRNGLDKPHVLEGILSHSESIIREIHGVEETS